MTAAVCSKGGGVKVNNGGALRGGGVEVNSGSATMTMSLRKRTTVARSEAGVEAVACSRAGDDAVACSGPGSRVAGGGGGVTVSRVTTKQEREREVKNLLSVARESMGMKF
jgi:hypothetical protein